MRWDQLCSLHTCLSSASLSAPSAPRSPPPASQKWDSPPGDLGFLRRKGVFPPTCQMDKLRSTC